MSRPNPRFHYKQSSARYLKRLRNLLSRLPKADGLEAFWVLDRGRMDIGFRQPLGYQYPSEFLSAAVGEPGAIHGWEIEALITELLACPSHTAARTLNAKSWAAVAELTNSLRNIGNAQAGLIEPGLIWRIIFRTLHRQTPWQIHNWNTADAVRWWSIFQSDLLRKIFRAQVGVTVRKFIQMGMAWNQILNGAPYCNRPFAGPDFYVNEDEIDSFVAAVSAPLDEACTLARAVVRNSEEIDFRRSALRQKPVVVIRDAYIRPLEQLLIWRITSGLYYDVVGDTRAPNEIGRQYEEYTRDLFRAFAPGIQIDGDFEYGTRQRPQRTPDCIAHKEGKVELVIECKAKKIPLVVQTSLLETEERTAAIGEIAKGVAQVRLFKYALRKEEVPAFRAADGITLIVATLDDWIFTGADIKKEVFERAREICRSRGMNPDDINESEVVLCTAAELDRLVSRYSFDTLRAICQKNLEPHYGNYALLGVASECFKEQRHQPQYPLEARLDDLIGMQTNEHGEEFLVKATEDY